MERFPLIKHRVVGADETIDTRTEHEPVVGLPAINHELPYSKLLVACQRPSLRAPGKVL